MEGGKVGQPGQEVARHRFEVPRGEHGAEEHLAARVQEEARAGLRSEGTQGEGSVAACECQTCALACASARHLHPPTGHLGDELSEGAEVPH